MLAVSWGAVGGKLVRGTCRKEVALEFLFNVYITTKSLTKKVNNFLLVPSWVRLVSKLF